jgi:hypothetical protein
MNLLIGALAVECGALLWSFGADFVRMEKLRLIERYDPRSRIARVG